jgi:hypothetical protein
MCGSAVAVGEETWWESCLFYAGPVKEGKFGSLDSDLDGKKCTDGRAKLPFAFSRCDREAFARASLSSTSHRTSAEKFL